MCDEFHRLAKYRFTSTLHLKLEPQMHFVFEIFCLRFSLDCFYEKPFFFFHLKLNLTVNIFHRRRLKVQYNEKRDMEDALDMRFNYSNSLASSEEIFWNMDGVTMSQWGIFLNALRSLVGRGSIFGYLLTIVLTSCGIANNIETWSLLNFSKKISNWNVHC